MATKPPTSYIVYEIIWTNIQLEHIQTHHTSDEVAT